MRAGTINCESSLPGLSVYCQLLVAPLRHSTLQHLTWKVYKYNYNLKTEGNSTHSAPFSLSVFSVWLLVKHSPSVAGPLFTSPSIRVVQDDGNGMRANA